MVFEKLRIFARDRFTPTDNSWFLEFNGESCEPFPGYEVWSFAEYYIFPRDTAISTGGMGNVVVIQLSLFNTINNGGS